MKAGSTAMTQRLRGRVSSRSMFALPDPRRPDRANPPNNFWWSFFLTALAWSTCIGFPLDWQSTRNWGFKGVQMIKGVQEEIPREVASTPSNQVSSISTRTMHQSTTPSFSQTIWPRWASRQFLSLPIVQTLLPVTFGYSLSLEAVIMRQLRRWKTLWRRSLVRLHKKDFDGAFQKLLEQYQQVYCSRRRLLKGD